jgi:hypothetical protein
VLAITKCRFRRLAPQLASHQPEFLNPAAKEVTPELLSFVTAITSFGEQLRHNSRQ